MRDIAIYGAGGMGREAACLIQIINKKEPTWNLIGFFDDGKNIGESNEYGCVIGGIKELNTWNKPLCLVFAIGSSQILSRLTSTITNHLLDFPNIISPDTIYFDENNVTMGKGNLISLGCLISCNVKIGDFNLLNSNITVGHDVVIGNCNAIMPNTRISGSVTIGNENFFGVSSVILQQVQIGNCTVIGANSLIIRKTKDGMTYMGSPATIVHY